MSFMFKVIGPPGGCEGQGKGEDGERQPCLR